jgi:2-octaprenyl-6-methoxyphenol hydroxylase
MKMFDVIIVGNGLVGATLACALGRDCRVAVIDQKDLPSSKTIASTKALALAWPSITCLKSLGVWPLIESFFSPIFKVHISKQQRFGRAILAAKDRSLPFLGGVVDSNILNQALVDTAKTLKNVEFFQPDAIEAAEKTKAGFSLSLQSKTRLSAPLLVASDGTHSLLRKQQGIHHQTRDHQQIAIVAAVTLRHEQLGMAFEHFLDHGAIALLPSGQKTLKSVWVSAKDAGEKLMQCSDVDYLSALQAQFGYRLGHFHHLGSRFSYPLQSVVAESLYQHRFVLIGNAANTLHPIAAQGFNLGLRDAAFLAEVVIKAQQAKEDIGSIPVLCAYAKTREIDHQQTRQFLGLLTEFHQAQTWGILGGLVPGLKEWVIAQSLGQRTRLPKLCRGVAL